MRISHPILQNSPRRLEDEAIHVHYEGTHEQYLKRNYAYKIQEAKRDLESYKRSKKKVYPDPSVFSIFIILFKIKI